MMDRTYHLPHPGYVFSLTINNYNNHENNEKISREVTRRKKVEVKVEVEEMVPFGQVYKIGVDHAIMQPCSLTHLIPQYPNSPSPQFSNLCNLWLKEMTQ
jgi:hypothetical protein